MKTKLSSDKKSDKEKKLTGFAAIGSLFEDYQLEDKGGYITQEFQDYGYRLAAELDDLKHKSLYIKLAKETERGLLEESLSFVSDAENVKNKGKLFMWKLGQLKKNSQEKKNLNSSQTKPNKNIAVKDNS